jgi:hypothetical protein
MLETLALLNDVPEWSSKSKKAKAAISQDEKLSKEADKIANKFDLYRVLDEELFKVYCDLDPSIRGPQFLDLLAQRTRAQSGIFDESTVENQELSCHEQKSSETRLGGESQCPYQSRHPYLMFSQDYYDDPFSQVHKLFDFALSHQIVIFTLLSRCKFWPKISKTNYFKSAKDTGVGFLSSWFRMFKWKYAKFVDAGKPATASKKDAEVSDIAQLFKAVAGGDVQRARNLLLKGIDVNVQNDKDKMRGLLHYAARTGSKVMVDMLAAFKPNVELRDETGMTPLFYGVESKDACTVRTLLELGAQPNVVDSTGSSPIYWGVYCSTVEVLDLLKTYGSKLHVGSRQGRTPLLKSCFMGKFDMVEWLLQSPEIIEEINAQDSRGRTALHTSCWGPSGGRHGKLINGTILKDSPESLRAVLAKGANVVLSNLALHS